MTYAPTRAKDPRILDVSRTGAARRTSHGSRRGAVAHNAHDVDGAQVDDAGPGFLSNVMRLGNMVAICVISGCTTAAPAAEPPGDPEPSSPDAGKQEAGPAPAAPHPVSGTLQACSQKKGDIKTIADAVARFNALAPNADAACFLATLPRPLAVVATSGVTSAQPAGGKDSPRLFFLLPTLVVSTVPSGDGSKAVEFGQWTAPGRTLKGELAVPVQTALAADAPFQKILRGSDGTVCATCHRYEQPSPTLANGFVSAAFKPEPGTFVTVAELRKLHDSCSAQAETSPRCDMFHAMFDFGDVSQGSFPSEVETFFQH